MDNITTNFQLIFEQGNVQNYISLFENNDSIFNDVHYPTGFKELDRTLNGGLTAGLTIIGAVSSLGKTTFTLQIADNVAHMGMPVLVFSLEMRPEHLLAKNMSRYMYECALREGKHMICYAKSYSDLMKEEIRKKFSGEELLLHKAAIKTSKGLEDNLVILSKRADDRTFNIDDIVAFTKWYIKEKKKKPLVIIDYLQYIAPSRDTSSKSDKQNMDDVVGSLIDLAQTERIPVVAISSLSRAGYDKPVNMESFKESGSIEYSAETLIGLQFKGVGEKEFDINEAKSRIPRDVELVLLKNRGSNVGNVINYKFYGKHNYFEEEGFCELSENVRTPFDEGCKQIRIF